MFLGFVIFFILYDLFCTNNLSTVTVGEIKSVYVRNLSPTVSASEIEEEFKKFGQLTGEGVAIRRLKVIFAFLLVRCLNC